jgi:hypothetical protein
MRGGRGKSAPSWANKNNPTEPTAPTGPPVVFPVLDTPVFMDPEVTHVENAMIQDWQEISRHFRSSYFFVYPVEGPSRSFIYEYPSLHDASDSFGTVQ